MESHPELFKLITVGQAFVPGLWHGMSKANYKRFMQDKVSDRSTTVPAIPASALGADLMGPGWYFTPVIKEAVKYMNLNVPDAELNTGKLLLCILSDKKNPDFSMAITRSLIRRVQPSKTRPPETIEEHERRTAPYLGPGSPDILMYHRVGRNTLKLKFSNHVERRYMIVLVFDFKQIASGLNLQLNVSETLRMLPSGWTNLFDPYLAASLKKDKLSISNMALRTDRIVTYNLCFGCMSGSSEIAKRDATGGEFARACAEKANLTTRDGILVSKCLDHAASNLNDLGADNALFIALQELASQRTVDDIVALSKRLSKFKQYIQSSALSPGVHTYICSLVSSDLEVLERSGGDIEPGRGWLALYCRGRGTHFLLVNLHNKHGDPTLQKLQSELTRSFRPEVMPGLYMHLMAGRPIEVYVAGDLNTKPPHDRDVNFKPFAAFAAADLMLTRHADTATHRKLAEVTVASTGTTNTCCNSKLQNGQTDVSIERDAGYGHIADHILCAPNRTSTYRTSAGRLFEASDHLPVCIDVECLTSNTRPNDDVVTTFTTQSTMGASGQSGWSGWSGSSGSSGWSGRPPSEYHGALRPHHGERFSSLQESRLRGHTLHATQRQGRTGGPGIRDRDP